MENRTPDLVIANDALYQLAMTLIRKDYATVVMLTQAQRNNAQL